MNPSNNQPAGTPTPGSVEGQAAITPMPEAGARSAVPVITGQVPQTAPMATIPLPLPSDVAPPALPTSGATTTSNSTAGFRVADDKDVIEPEWVHKAKAIVLTTSEDPYKQSEELTVFKADYMQKRYNKTVKLK
jgi:hypothetical protein